MVSSDEEDFSEPDDGSVEDFEKNTWADWCDYVFGTAFDAFPSEADSPRPAVMFSDHLFSEEELADTVVSVHREVAIYAIKSHHWCKIYQINIQLNTIMYFFHILRPF